jgi:hypothetical protein
MADESDDDRPVSDGTDGEVEGTSDTDEDTAGGRGTDEDTAGGRDTASGEETKPRPRTGWERLTETFLRPAPTPGRRTEPEKIDYASMTDEEKRRRINQIDPMERKVGLAASALAAVFALVYTVPYMVSKISVATTVKPVHKTCTHGYTYVASTNTCNGVYPASHYTFPLILWLVFAVAIYVTVRIGRRAPMAFAIVLTGLAFGTVIIMLPYVAAGGWLLLRAYRTQKYGAPTAKAPVEGYVKPPPRSSRTAGGSTSANGTRNSTRRRRQGAPEPEPDTVRRPPSASKRYTPKSAPKKKVPPPS